MQQAIHKNESGFHCHIKTDKTYHGIGKKHFGIELLKDGSDPITVLDMTDTIGKNIF